MIATAFGSVETAVEAMRTGAYDFIQKPFAPEVVRLKVARALELRAERRARERAEAESAALRDDVAREYRFAEIVGETPPMRALFQTIEKVAPTDASVYIHGESGTGKELVARAIHARSKRAQGPFVKVNCGALTETLLESELFGHERGAFTGAIKRKLGRFELADKGTLFLDEIGDVTPGLQLKLLRVLQEREFERVGGEETIKVDVRVLSATHRDIAVEVAAGRFREDLFYRLHVVPCEVPPLRERKEDIPRLAAHFIAKLGPRTNAAIDKTRGITDAALARLGLYAWPGNVRELENVIEQALVFAEGTAIDVGALPASRARRAARKCAGAPRRRDVAPRAARGSRAAAHRARLRQERRREDRDGAPLGDQDQRALLQAGKVRHRHHREPRRQGVARRRAGPRRRDAAGGRTARWRWRRSRTFALRRGAPACGSSCASPSPRPAWSIGCASAAGARRGASPARRVEEGRASYYGRGFAGRKTASGERFDPNAMTAASPSLPFGTRVRVSRANGRSVTVRINDRCGCPGGRIVDLSEGAARRLGMIKEGVVTVRMEILGG